MSTRLTGIDVFVAVVESGGFAAASRRLRQTRSAVAKQIAALESRLGVQLFLRTTRKQQLTDVGRSYYTRCSVALTQLQEATEELNFAQSDVSGVVRVTMPVMFGRHCVMPVLQSLMQQHHKLQLHLSFTDRVVDLLAEGHDVAVRVGRLQDSSSLVARPLGEQRMCICASPAYLRRMGKPRALADLQHHSAVVYGRDCPEPWRLTDSQGRSHSIEAPARLWLDDLQAIADAAMAGAGLAWLPCWLVTPHLRTNQLEKVFTTYRVTPRPIQVVWPKNKFLSARARLVIDTLIEQVPTQM